MNKKLYIGNLPYRVLEEELRELFSGYGEIVDVKVLRDPVTGRSRGFGFVTYSSGEHAKQALDMDGEEMMGRRLYVKFARDRQYIRATEATEDTLEVETE